MVADQSSDVDDRNRRATDNAEATHIRRRPRYRLDRENVHDFGDSIERDCIILLAGAAQQPRRRT